MASMLSLAVILVCPKKSEVNSDVRISFTRHAKIQLPEPHLQGKCLIHSTMPSVLVISPKQKDMDRECNIVNYLHLLIFVHVKACLKIILLLKWLI